MVDPLFSLLSSDLEAALNDASISPASLRWQEAPVKNPTPMAHRHQRPAGCLLGGRPNLADWRKALDRLDGSYSPHTLLSYCSDFGSFESWCKGRDLKYLPAAPSTAAAYVTAQTDRPEAQTRRYSQNPLSAPSA